MLARRWESASPLLRRALAPILITGGATTALLGAMLIAEETSSGVALTLESASRVALATVPVAYLFGLFSARLARVESRRPRRRTRPRPRARTTPDALARALRDPTLELGYWLPEPSIRRRRRHARMSDRQPRSSHDPRTPRAQGRCPRVRPGLAKTPRCSTPSRAPPASRSKTSGSSPNCATPTRRDQGHSRTRIVEAALTQSDAASNATFTTAPNRASSPSPSTCAWPRNPARRPSPTETNA